MEIPAQVNFYVDNYLNHYMLSSFTQPSDQSVTDTWQIVVFSHQEKITGIFKESLEGFSYLECIINLWIISDIEELNDRLDDLSNHSVIHIDGSFDESQDILKKIRKKPNCKYTYLVVWDEKPWEKYEVDFLQSYKINDVRSFNALNKKRIAFIIDTNIRNQSHFLSNFSMKENLEIKIKDRLKAVTRLNKKLQAAIIQNSNINTKLHKQRNQIEQQNKEIKQRNHDLEKAFKKSSRQHIQIHKAFYENEQQREKLEKALKEIQNKNSTLKAQNEEIIAQRDHIEQQHEEIQSQHDLALKQRDKIMNQQEEINDNIIYASRIQTALFPPNELLHQLLPVNFVLNRPKDVVSGDFYWISQNRRNTIVAVADCTGHGISGAMMSMLGTAFLNEIVNKNDVTGSAQILEQLRERVITSLHQQIGDDIDYSRDGMDIAVCNIDILDNKLEFSGANNPIYIIREGELIELKPDKMPIGIHEFYNEPFSTQYFELKTNDVVYMFSDGFADQFGGKKGKKLKYSRFKEMLIKNHELPFNEQLIFFNNAFDEWRGTNEQIDDVMLLGFKII